MPASGGWGLGKWAVSPWGGYVVAPGGELPTETSFDVFCVEAVDGTLFQLFTYPDVETSADPSQFIFDYLTGDLQFSSGAPSPITEAEVDISVPVPAAFTLQFTLRCDALPLDFSSLTTNHVYIQASDPVGASFGLLISQVGLAYLGAAHLSGGTVFTPDSFIQPLPNSQVLISLGEYITFRVACDFTSGTTYIYVTDTADLPTVGHQLRYVLPGFIAADLSMVPANVVLLRVRGTDALPSRVTLNELCLGTGPIIPSLPPRADAGVDQAVRTCSIARLDGSASFDPQGVTLTYLWELVDAPGGSAFDFGGADGGTIPLLVPTGFTNKFYSVSLSLEHTDDAFDPGDVLVVAGQPHKLVGYGTDGHGFFAQAQAYELPDNLSGSTVFKVLRQRGISGVTSIKPTFYPDVPGLYKFNLYVSNNVLLSLPAEVILNVTESFLPHGITPNLGFMWNYLSDFWKLVEDRERIQVFWGALAQTVAAELLNLWQIDYAKSLRDVQRTLQRKWLHYDLALYQSSTLLEETRARAIFGGLSSFSMPVAGTSEPVGKILVLDVPGQDLPVQISFSGVGPYTPAYLAARITAFLNPIDARIVARPTYRRDNTAAVVRIDAPFQIQVNPASTTVLFMGANGMPSGTGGQVINARTYLVERDISSLAAVSNSTGDSTTVAAGDYLVVDKQTYRIARIVDNLVDPFFYQRITLLEDIPLTAGGTWYIAGQVKSLDINFYTAFASFGDTALVELFELDAQNTAFAAIPVLGASAVMTDTMAVDLSIVGYYLAQPKLFSAFFYKLLRRTYIPVSELVVDVPYLQEIIKVVDQEAVLRRNVDYFVEEYRGSRCIRFVTNTTPTLDVWEGQAPPDRLWAEMTYLDNRPVIEANFGIPAAFTLDDLSQFSSNVDYLSTVRGLWYAYFNGPTLFNLRVGAQILLGLPFAEEAGIITELRNDFSTTTGRILVQDRANTEIVRSYTYPHVLALDINPVTKVAYAVGDTVEQFAPLVKGVEVVDWVSTPTWFEGYMGQGSFYEVEKLFRFLVRVSSAAFNLSALLFVQNFILRIKPTYTYPLFVVQVPVPAATVSTSAVHVSKGFLALQEGPNFQELVSGAWDHFRAYGGTSGSTWGAYDQRSVLYPPTYNTPTIPVGWAYDKAGGTFPHYGIAATLTQTVIAGPVAFDGLFSYDVGSSTTDFGHVADHFITALGPIATSPYTLGTPIPATSTGSVGYVYLEIAGQDLTPQPLEIHLLQNSVVVGTYSVTKGANSRDSIILPLLISVTAGDTLEVRIGTLATYVQVSWHDLAAFWVDAGIAWVYDVGSAAGTYTKYRSL